MLHANRSHCISSCALQLDYASGKCAFEQTPLEAAISSIVFELVENEASRDQAAWESLRATFRGVSQDNNRRLVAHVQSVTLADLRRAVQQYLLPLFDTVQTKCAVCCNASKAPAMVTAFEELGRPLTLLDSIEQAFPDLYDENNDDDSSSHAIDEDDEGTN
jgi:Zn-dependent M16 (insulinase) family peptidase